MLRCGPVALDWSWDTDGSALGFAVSGPAAAACPSAPADRAVMDAVLQSESWAVESDSRITLNGPTPVVLDRGP